MISIVSFQKLQIERNKKTWETSHSIVAYVSCVAEPPQFSPNRVASKGAFVWVGFGRGGFCPRGFLADGVFVQGGFWQRGFLAEGGGVAWVFFGEGVFGEGGFGRGFLERGVWKGGFWKGGICPRTGVYTGRCSSLILKVKHGLHTDARYESMYVKKMFHHCLLYFGIHIRRSVDFSPKAVRSLPSDRRLTGRQHQLEITDGGQIGSVDTGLYLPYLLDVSGLLYCLTTVGNAINYNSF